MLVFPDIPGEHKFVPHRSFLISMRQGVVSFPGIFYLPTTTTLTEEEIRQLVSDGFEIGGHTSNHPQDLKMLNDNDLKNEIEDNKSFLEAAIEKRITKFCYPRGRYDDRVIKAVVDAGYTEARTTKVLETAIVSDSFKTPTTIHAFQRQEYGDVPWPTVARNQFDMIKNYYQANFHLWGHSWEIEKNNDWYNLEELFKYISENKES